MFVICNVVHSSGCLLNYEYLHVGVSWQIIVKQNKGEFESSSVYFNCSSGGDAQYGALVVWSIRTFWELKAGEVTL